MNNSFYIAPQSCRLKLPCKHGRKNGSSMVIRWKNVKPNQTNNSMQLCSTFVCTTPYCECNVSIISAHVGHYNSETVHHQLVSSTDLSKYYDQIRLKDPSIITFWPIRMNSICHILIMYSI